MLTDDLPVLLPRVLPEEGFYDTMLPVLTWWPLEETDEQP
jgi:hypothetical protein